MNAATWIERTTPSDQTFRVVDIVQIGKYEFLVTTESKAFGIVTQRVTMVPDTVRRSDPTATVLAEVPCIGPSVTTISSHKGDSPNFEVDCNAST